MKGTIIFFLISALLSEEAMFKIALQNLPISEEYIYYVKATDNNLIESCREQLLLPIENRNLHINGQLEYTNGGFNQHWNWHILPDQWTLAEVSIEVCDGLPSYIENNPEYWIDNVGSFCAWSSYIYEEITNQECFDFTGINFGECEMLLGVGLVNENCSYISGCDWMIDGIDYSNLFFDSINECNENCSSNECESDFIEINDFCFYQQDISFLQTMITNSYQSGIDLGCDDGDSYCGSPNPYMDSYESWMDIMVDGEIYEWNSNGNGVVEPLELGVQEWQNGRLTSLMCGAYIYCQLSGPIPEQINNLTAIETFRIEGNYFSGFIPESICELDIDYDNSLEFDVRYNQLCPPYPSCIDINADFWGQYDEECNEIGDVNHDYTINILDIISLVSIIFDSYIPDYQTFFISDINSDGVLDVLDIILIVNLILNI